jgi:hypothetical protein
MSIFICGDIHGEHDIYKLGSNYFDASDLTKDDYMIICGDFGLIWDYRGETKEERYWLDWLENKPWTTLFVDGNHENFDRLNNDYEIEEWNGGKVHRIGNSIYHLMRGEVFNLQGKLFFCMGGAPSHDIEYRTENKSWWRAEVPSQEERAKACETLDKYNWKVDYVITHDAPSDIAEMLLWNIRDYSRGLNEYTNWLQYIAENLDFKRWFFGHYHMDRTFDDGKYNAMFYDVKWLM